MAAPMPALPPAAPPLCPCCARAAVVYRTTARLSIAIRVIFIFIRFDLHCASLVSVSSSCKKPFLPSGILVQQMSYIQTKRERNRIQIVVNATCVSQFGVEIRRQAGIHPGGEAIVARNVGRTSRLLANLKITTMRQWLLHLD